MIIKRDAEPIDESLPVEPEVIEVKDREFEDGWLTHKQVNAAIKKMTDWKNKKYCPGDSISRGRMVGVERSPFPVTRSRRVFGGL